jgi:hypothetical protein
MGRAQTPGRAMRGRQRRAGAPGGAADACGVYVFGLARRSAVPKHQAPCSWRVRGVAELPGQRAGGCWSCCAASAACTARQQQHKQLAGGGHVGGAAGWWIYAHCSVSPGAAGGPCKRRARCTQHRLQLKLQHRLPATCINPWPWRPARAFRQVQAQALQRGGGGSSCCASPPCSGCRLHCRGHNA